MTDRRKYTLEFIVEVVDNGYLVKFGDSSPVSHEEPTVIFCNSYVEVGEKVSSVVDKVVKLPDRKIETLTYL